MQDKAALTYEKLHFVRSSFPSLASLILEVWTDNGTHIANLFYFDQRWQVVWSSTTDEKRIEWNDFVEIFRQFCLFIADEGARMLTEKDQDMEEINPKLNS